MKSEPRIKSPLRYPGGKSRVAKDLVRLFPTGGFKEYREPFLGGGSVFFETVQRYPDVKFWLNDLFRDLYSFWTELRDSPEDLVEEIRKIKNLSENGRETFEFLLKEEKEGKSEVLRTAARFFALNRMTFSGTTMSGGFSKQSFERRFTESSVERCRKSSKLLFGKEITNLDYSELLSKDGENVFVFMDPPYFLGDAKSKLYGKNGDMHSGFDHLRFYNCCKKCKHKWMITYNDCEFIRSLFEGYRIETLSFSYGMSNDKDGNEIIIRNY